MKHILAREGFLGRAAVLLILLLALAAIWVPDRSSAVQTEGSSSMPGPSQTPAPGRMGPDTGATKLVPSGNPTSAGMEEKRRIPRPPLPASATQADRGAQVYMLVCSACHGNRGQGLTDEWRATWAPEDQNCWQTKCHAPSHPPDGFEIPRYAPPVVSPAVPARFRTALDFFENISTTMPWHEPASLQEDEYWEVTAYLVRENKVDPIMVPLDRERAAGMMMQPAAVGATTPAPLMPSPAPDHPSPSPTVPSALPAASAPSTRIPVWVLLLIVVLGGLGLGIWFWLRAHAKS